MDEWVDVLDAEGRGTGERILKSEAHKRGIFHPTVHIWFYTANSEVLLQQRAATKDTFPLLWDVSVAGHIEAGEGVLSAALREIQEEVGLRVEENDLIPLGLFKSVQKHSSVLVDCEFHHTFICPLKIPFTTLDIQQEEVAQVKLIPLSTWERELFSASVKLQYVPHEESYYREVINAIRKRL